MQDFLKYAWSILTDSPTNVFGWCGLIFLWIATIGVVILLIIAILYLADSMFLTKHEGEGSVIEKHYYPEHHSTTPEYDVILKTTQMKTTYHPPRWSVEISIGNKTGGINVSEEAYSIIAVDEKVWCIYSVGRFSKCMYIKAISNSSFSSS